jgi:negative regulator of sigma-B (phosphoserine phosphatase)
MTLAIEYRTQSARNDEPNGDAVFVKVAGCITLFAVIDGLGHGRGAAEASQCALARLATVEPATTVEQLLPTLDRALSGTRGAALMLGKFENGILYGCGVGNVEMRVIGDDLPIVLTPGILGRGVSRPRFFSGNLKPGTRLLVFTDGISGRFAADDFKSLDRKKLCEHMMLKFRRGHDDASVMVADVGGGS